MYLSVQSNKNNVRSIFIALLIFTFVSTNARDIDNDELRILISCGFAGSTSAEVSNIQELALTEKYEALKEQLFSNEKTEAVLSAIAIQQLESIGTVSLSYKEKQKIAEISIAKDPYSICYTCTQHFTGIVNDLFEDSNSLHIY